MTDPRHREVRSFVLRTGRLDVVAAKGVERGDQAVRERGDEVARRWDEAEEARVSRGRGLREHLMHCLVEDLLGRPRRARQGLAQRGAHLGARGRGRYGRSREAGPPRHHVVHYAVAEAAHAFRL